MAPDLMASLDRDGFTIARQAASPDGVEGLAAATSSDSTGPGARIHRSSIFGRRNLLEVAKVRALASGPRLGRIVQAILGKDAFAVRALFFDKTPQANWQLGWHQDRAIAVRERHEVPGYGGWSVKSGVPHVLPPAEILAGMLTVRLHLDPCDASHGALQVLPGSHRQGFLPEESLRAARSSPDTVWCEVEAGDAVIMRPLLAHASGRCEKPAHRRVVHVEYASSPLPSPLEWFDVVPTQTDAAASL